MGELPVRTSHGDDTIPPYDAEGSADYWQMSYEEEVEVHADTAADLAAARARVAELEAALREIHALAARGTGHDTESDDCGICDADRLALAALAGGAQTEAPAEGEEG